MKDTEAKDTSEILERVKEADMQEKHVTVIETLKSVFRSVDKMPISLRFRLTDNLRMIGRLSEARTILNECESAVPADKRWLWYLHMGQIAVDGAALEDAADYFKKSMEASPDRTEPYIYLATTCSRLERFDESIIILTNGLHAQGDRDELFLNLGYAFRAIGNYMEAKKAFISALEITPDYSEAHSALSDISSVLT